MVEQKARRSLAMSHYAYVLDMGRNRYEGAGDKLLHDPKVVELYLGGRGRLASAPASSIPRSRRVAASRKARERVLESLDDREPGE